MKALLFLIACAACALAGYRAGYTKGKGWLGAVLEDRCVVACDAVKVRRIPLQFAPPGRPPRGP